MYDTLGDLKTAIQAELARGSSDTTLVARLGEFVTMGEARLYRGQMPLRVREMETRATLTFTAGTANLPDGFLQARRLTWDGTCPVNLTYRDAEEFYGATYYNATGAPPVIFTIDGNVIDIKPSASGTATLSYYAEPDALEEDNDSNDVLTAWGQLYLFAALIEAFIYLRNTDKRDEAIQRFSDGVMGANLSAARARYAGTQLAPRIPGACR